MPRPRYQKLSHEKQARILEAAAREIAERGYDKASLNRILEAAGLSKGAAYYYFEDKDDLLGTVMLHYMEQVLAAADLDVEKLTADNYWSRIVEVGRTSVQWSRDNPWIVAALKGLLSLPLERRASGPLGKAYGKMVGFLHALVEQGQRLGVVRSDLPLDLLVAITIGLDEAADRWMLENWDSLSEEELSCYSEVLFGLWQRVLSPPESGT